MRRVFPAAVLAALFFVPGAGAWAWPAAGDVVQPFSFDPAHPYAAGQHRGVDIAGDAGSTVVAPEGGSVSFAGTVPTSGKSVTILTGDGYAVTLTHLGLGPRHEGRSGCRGRRGRDDRPQRRPRGRDAVRPPGYPDRERRGGLSRPGWVLARSCRDGAAVGGRAVAGPHASAPAADDRRRSHCAGCAGGRSSPDRCCRRPGRLDRLGVDLGPVRGPCRCSGCEAAAVSTAGHGRVGAAETSSATARTCAGPRQRGRRVGAAVDAEPRCAGGHAAGGETCARHDRLAPCAARAPRSGKEPGRFGADARTTRDDAENQSGPATRNPRSRHLGSAWRARPGRRRSEASGHRRAASCPRAGGSRFAGSSAAGPSTARHGRHRSVACVRRPRWRIARSAPQEPCKTRSYDCRQCRTSGRRSWWRLPGRMRRDTGTLATWRGSAFRPTSSRAITASRGTTSSWSAGRTSTVRR